MAVGARCFPLGHLVKANGFSVEGESENCWVHALRLNLHVLTNTAQKLLGVGR